MDAIVLKEKEEVLKFPPLQMWYQNKAPNVLSRVQEELQYM